MVGTVEEVVHVAHTGGEGTLEWDVGVGCGRSGKLGGSVGVRYESTDDLCDG